MEADHVLAHMRHLHSDVAQQTFDLVTKLEAVTKVVVDSAAQVKEGKTDLDLKILHRLEKAHGGLAEIVNSLPGAATLEMQRAGAEVMTELAGQVGKIAQQVAGDATAAARNTAFYRAVAGVAACALVFGGTGYALRAGADAINLSTARDRVSEANARADAAVAAAEEKASDEIDAIRKSSGWIGTAQGRLAKKFFDSGAGDIAAKCDSPDWEITERKGGKSCVPKKRDLLGGNAGKDGWKIP